MTNKEQVVEVIFEVVDSLNRQLAKNVRVEKSLETVVIGKNGSFDSLGLINFLIALEEKIEDRFGATIGFFDSPLISLENTELVTMKILAEFITDRINAV